MHNFFNRKRKKRKKKRYEYKYSTDRDTIMTVWPLSPPQRSRIPSGSSRDSVGGNDGILETLAIPGSNALVMLTPSRVLVYNFKPLALVAAHNRSEESIAEFGESRALRLSSFVEHEWGFTEGVYSEGKVIFYVITKNNYILTYQILRNSSQYSVIQEYGIPPSGGSSWIRRDEDTPNDTAFGIADEDTLTVLDRNQRSRVIQCGFPVSRKRGLFVGQWWGGDVSTGSDAHGLPIKNVELRLKVVFKFDYKILDVLAFKSPSASRDGAIDEHLLVLFPHGLQSLEMVDFKLNKRQLIDVTNGFKICNFPEDSSIVVISQDDATLEISLTIIDIHEFKVRKERLDSLHQKLFDCFEFHGMIILVFLNTLVYFDVRTNEVYFEFQMPNGMEIKLCKSAIDNFLVVVTRNNSLCFFSKFGNLLFATDNEENDNQLFPGVEYTDFAYMDSTLIMVTKNGEYQVWPLWESVNDQFNNFRAESVPIITNNRNEILIISPTPDLSSSNDNFSVIKLPTRTFNNWMSLVCVNGNNKLLAVYVANKQLLLIYNLETGVWCRFYGHDIRHMQWLGQSYLLIHKRQSNEAEDKPSTSVVVCAQIPLQNLRENMLSDYIIWTYEVPSSEGVINMFVNSCETFKHLKIKSENNGTEPMNQIHEYYKTGEVIVVTDTAMLALDIIASLTVSGLIMVRTFYEYARIQFSDTTFLKLMKWAVNVEENYLVFSGDNLYKLEKKGEEPFWHTTELLKGVERVVEVHKSDIYFIQEHKVMCYKLGDLLDNLAPFLVLDIIEDSYPVSISPSSAIMYSLLCSFNPEFSKLITKGNIYLDKLISAQMDNHVGVKEIYDKYSSLRHYNFALEKILSFKILEGESIDKILELVKLSDNTGQDGITNGMLHIVGNCLRKIETKHWKQLFLRLKLTPRDLLTMCMEYNDAKMLGVLLLVFLNFESDDLIDNLKEDSVPSDHAESTATPETAVENTMDATILHDSEFMLQILKILVNDAITAVNVEKATEAWDMCFQLARLLKELDTQTNSNLIDQTVAMLG